MIFEAGLHDPGAEPGQVTARRGRERRPRFDACDMEAPPGQGESRFPSRAAHLQQACATLDLRHFYEVVDERLGVTPEEMEGVALRKAKDSGGSERPPRPPELHSL